MRSLSRRRPWVAAAGTLTYIPIMTDASRNGLGHDRRNDDAGGRVIENAPEGGRSLSLGKVTFAGKNKMGEMRRYRTFARPQSNRWVRPQEAVYDYASEYSAAEKRTFSPNFDKA